MNQKFITGNHENDLKQLKAKTCRTNLQRQTEVKPNIMEAAKLLHDCHNINDFFCSSGVWGYLTIWNACEVCFVEFPHGSMALTLFPFGLRLPGKCRGLRTARKLRNHRREQRWHDKQYKKAHLGTALKANPFGGASHAKGIVLEKVWVPRGDGETQNAGRGQLVIFNRPLRDPVKTRELQTSHYRVRTVMENLEKLWNFKMVISRPGEVLEKT